MLKVAYFKIVDVKIKNLAHFFSNTFIAGYQTEISINFCRTFIKITCSNIGNELFLFFRNTLDLQQFGVNF